MNMKKYMLAVAMFLMIISSGTNAQPLRVLDYLYSISGKKTIAGQHNKEPNAVPAMWTDFIKETTGKYPALWSGDFLFQQDNIDNRWKMIKEARKQWDNGAVINLMWHACHPMRVSLVVGIPGYLTPNWTTINGRS